MAPMNGTKRARPRVETEEVEEDSGVEAASSSLRQNTSARKRVRLSATDELSDEASVRSTTLDVSGDENASMTDMVDEEHEEYDPDMDDEEAVRRAHESLKKRGVGQNHAALCAIIEEITCTNFMCHTHLSISIGPLINFIIGHNGSGKSAVLTALTICLGGKATATSRGQNLKSFIKEGKERASLSVKIKNQGELAYLPELYGSSIIVERHFARNGTSGFSLRNANGKQVSSKKSDLDDILDALALQLDNPMNVLSQDMARQFLNSSNPAEKYKFFIKGTHLEQLDTDYKILNESLESNIIQLTRLEEMRDEAKKGKDRATEQVKRAEAQKSLHDKAKAVRRQIVWSQVGDLEQDLSKRDEQIRQTGEDVQKREQEVERSDAKLEQAEQARDQARQTIQQLKEDLEPQQQEKSRVSDLFDGNKKELIEIQTQQREIKGELNRELRNIEKCEAYIEAEKEKLRSADDGRHAQKMEEIQIAKDEREALFRKQRDHSTGAQAIQRAIVDTQEAVKNAQPTIMERKEQVRTCENALAKLTNSRGSWQDAFPASLPSLLRAIQNEKRFREKPVGPLGSHVALLKPEWSSVLEKSFGATLEGFAVTSKPDQILLTELMRKSKYPVRVYISSSRPIDTSNNEPADNLTTWMRVLKIDNDLARNTFIINQAIEQTVLVPNQEEAAAMMLRGRIQNVRQIFTLNTDRTGGGFRFAFSGAGNQSQSPIEGFRGPPRMQTDAESRIAMEKDNLANLKQDLMQAEQALRDAQNNAKQAQQTLTRHKREAHQFTVDIQRQDDTISQLNDELEEATPQNGVLDSYEEKLRDAREAKTQHENAYQETVSEKDRLNREQRSLKDKLNGIEAEIEEAETRIKKGEAYEEKLDQKRFQATLAKNEVIAARDDAKQLLEKYQHEREEAHEAMEAFIVQAREVSERVAVERGKTTAALEAKYKELVEAIKKSQRETGGNREELLEKLLAAEASYAENERVYQDISIAVRTLGKSVEHRRFRWLKFRKAITTQARGNFMYLLSERQFRGDLNIDHDAKLLNINIEPDITRKNAKGRQTQTLSGGEKSFSTICLLLSLWHAMGSPIRCLDEFDVFMDQVNRDISMKMLIDAARSATSRQFILITPQSMNNIHLGEDVKIHKMSDPERGQTTLPFGRS